MAHESLLLLVPLRTGGASQGDREALRRWNDRDVHLEASHRQAPGRMARADSIRELY